jgi:hypothetical protein
MSYSSDEQNMTPLFAYLLVDDQQTQMTQLADGGGGAPTYHCLDSPCTKKYPSDDDECYTYKPYCDSY